MSQFSHYPTTDSDSRQIPDTQTRNGVRHAIGLLTDAVANRLQLLPRWATRCRENETIPLNNDTEHNSELIASNSDASCSQTVSMPCSKM